MKSISQKTVLIVAGPTASGKTKFAIQLAKAFNTSIISADSRQCYKELSIGVARPTLAELESAPHYFIASHSIVENVTAALFEQYALQLTEQLFVNNDVIVMVGGTGLYLRAFCNGIDHIPSISKEIRESIRGNYNLYGLNWLQNELRILDPLFASEGEFQNPQRSMRALEVATATGRSILSYHSKNNANRNFRIVEVAIDIDRHLLYERINERVDMMMSSGLLDEVRALTAFRDLNALQTVGYKELFDHLAGNSSLEQAVALIKQHTRQYAKRQLTWFKKDPKIHWIKPDEVDKVIAMVEEPIS